jgi:hypothetical protein
VVQRHIFGGQAFFLAPEQVNVGRTHQNMPYAYQPFFRQAGVDADTQEKNNLYQPEK